jgi:hypothetical protein
MKKRTIPVIIILVSLVLVFVYLNKDGKTLKSIDIDEGTINIEEKNTVEKYVRDNIKTIATDSPVLGGSWYVVSIDVFPLLDSGIVVYEDGHIQSNSNFTYKYDKNTKNVVIKSFLQNK